MPHSYGDAVTLVKKQADGTLVRSNAIVLSSSQHVPTTLDRKPVAGADPVEHLDLASPVATKVPPKSRDLGEIFRPVYDVAPYVEGAWLGYEAAAPAVATTDAELELGVANIKIGELEAQVTNLSGELDAVKATLSLNTGTNEMSSAPNTELEPEAEAEPAPAPAPAPAAAA